MLSILFQYKSVVVTNGIIRPVRFRLQPQDDAFSIRVRIPADSFVVRMVSASLLRLLVKQSERYTVVKKYLAICTSRPRMTRGR
jgi:hypothetical protein